jgi:DNA polymerase V
VESGPAAPPCPGGGLTRHVRGLVEFQRLTGCRPGEACALRRCTDALGVSLAWKDGESSSGVCKLPVPSDRFDELLDGARSALRRAYLPRGVATHMHVVAPELRRARGFQLSLFDPPDPKREAVARVKTAINDRYGRLKLRSASTLYLPAVYADPANDFDICDVRGKVCF